MLLGEEVEMVLRMKEEEWIRTVKLFINNNEIIFCSRIVLSGALSIGLRIEVIIGHIEALSVVWVTPLVKVEGVKACLEMVDNISKLMAPRPSYSY
jgi:uncharacterized membrane protein